MKKIKWENIISLVLGIVFVAGMVQHVQNNGFYVGLLGEVGMYFSSVVVAYIVVKTIRLENKNN